MRKKTVQLKAKSNISDLKKKVLALEKLISEINNFKLVIEIKRP